MFDGHKKWFPHCIIKSALRPGHTVLYGLIAAKIRQKVVSHEADDVVCVDVKFKMSYSQFILDVAGRGKNRNGVGRGKKF